MRRSTRILCALTLACAATASAAPFHAGSNEHAGEAITCDLPTKEHQRNSVGRDGLGLCVFTSIDMAARWANEPALIGFRDFMKKHPGGGWPEKVEEYLPRCAAAKGLPTPAYVQHTGGDADFLKLALKTGRYVCVTYNGRDGVFYRGAIAHMVNLVHLSEHWAVIQDNNYPGQWLWMPPAEFLSRWRGSGGGWAFVLLKSGPPPVPVNSQQWAVGSRRSSCQCSVFSVQPDKTPEPEEPDSTVNFGLDGDQVGQEMCFRLNGKEISRQEAYAAFGKLADDSHKLRLTIVGDEQLHKLVLADLATHPELLSLRDRLLVQAYPPDHWAIKNVGFAPGISLQPAANEQGQAPVHMRLRDYEGPAALAGAIRKADPLYKPDRDPGPNSPAPAEPAPAVSPSPTTPSIELRNVPPAAWVLGGLLVVLFFTRRKETS